MTGRESSNVIGTHGTLGSQMTSSVCQCITPVLSLAEIDCQMLERLVVQCIGCCRELRKSRHCVSNGGTTKYIGKENLSKNAPVSETLFSLESLVFGSILDRTRCQIE